MLCDKTYVPEEILVQFLREFHRVGAIFKAQFYFLKVGRRIEWVHWRQLRKKVASKVTFPKKIKKLTPLKSLSPGNPMNTTYFIYKKHSNYQKFSIFLEYFIK